tara:strand:- start:2997 stop:3590 length:594 start_codon:yes stop_codon:yes gene_type:complete
MQGLIERKMNFTNVLKSGLLIGFTSLSLISCNYIFENKKEKIEKTKTTTTRINTNKKEANLLVEASKNNIDILELCETIKDFEPQNNIKSLAENLEKTHFEILKNYNDLATEKLISIPNYTNFNNDIEMTALDNETFTETTLKLIKNKIINQIKLLDTLSETTNDVEFKVLALKDNYILKYNINKIETALNELNKSI